MAVLKMKANLPQISPTQKFDLEVEVNSKGNLSITLPQQTVKATGCFVPFSEIVTDFPIRNARTLSQIPGMGNGTATAKSVSGRNLQVTFPPNVMQEVLTLALTADYC